MTTFFDKEITEKYNGLDKNTLQDVLIDFFANYKQNELEILIGNNSINQEQFSNILRALKSTNGGDYFESVPERSDTLDISVYRNKNKDSQLRNFRITIPDALKIQEHCKSNTLKHSDIKGVYQKKKRINRINISEYNIIINHKEETNLDRNDGEMRDYLNLLKLHSNKYSLIYKTYRMKNRYSFLSTDSYKYEDKIIQLRLDITMVKQTDKPCREFVKSGVMNKENQYEIELEFIVSETDEDLEGQPRYDAEERVVGVGLFDHNSLEDVVKSIIRMKNNYPYILRKSEEKDAREEYNVLVYGVSRSAFISPKPVSLELQHLKKIKNNYCVTDKADGVSKLLFINDTGNVYLIDYNLSFFKTDIVCQSIPNTIINGEYLNLDKDKNLINLFMAYDIYYFDNTDVSTLEFKSGGDTRDRYSELVKAIQTIRGINQTPILIDLKHFEFVTDKLGEIVTNIFECSKNIWDKYTYGEPINVSVGDGAGESNGLGDGAGESKGLDNEDQVGNKYNYRLDGLIYTPTNVAVHNFLGKTWFSNYKWKPEYDNTIDFLIKEDSIGVRTIPLPTLEHERGGEYYEYDYVKYKTFILNVGYNVPKNKYCSTEDKTNDYISRKFTPSNPTLKNAHVAKLTLDNVTNNIYGKEYDHKTGIWNDTRDLIKPNTIVEFAYVDRDIADQNEFNWIPVRTRHDKTKEYTNFKSTGEGRPNYGNNHYTANSVWNNIFNPVTESMITTGKGVSSNSIYYMRDLTKKREESNLINLQTYHNRIIKGECLLHYAADIAKSNKANEEVLSQDIELLDIGCGKAGDLYKWDKYGINNVVGIEISYDNLYNKTDGACERYVQYCKSKQDESINCKFLEGDGSKINFGLKGDNLEIIKDKKFDIISCMFSIHYMIDSDEIYENINTYLKPGGVFIGACIDGSRISNLGKKTGSTEDELLWQIERDVDKLKVYIQTIGQTIEENVVNIDEGENNLVEKFENYRIKPNTIKSRGEGAGEETEGQATDDVSIMNFNEFGKMPNNIRRYAEKLYNKMTEPEKELSNMYKLFVFVKDSGDTRGGDGHSQLGSDGIDLSSSLGSDSM